MVRTYQRLVSCEHSDSGCGYSTLTMENLYALLSIKANSQDELVPICTNAWQCYLTQSLTLIGEQQDLPSPPEVGRAALGGGQIENSAIGSLSAKPTRLA